MMNSGQITNDYGFINWDLINGAITIIALMVHPDHRNAGIGRKLVESAICEIVKSNNQGLPINVLVSSMFPDSPPFGDLVKFYKSLGFAVEESNNEEAVMALVI